jgi:hypothetical protein
MYRILTLAALAITFAGAVPALADDIRPYPGFRHWQEWSPLHVEQRVERVAEHFDRKGDRINARLDEQAFRVSEYFAREATRAAAAGNYALAHSLQIQGERLRQHFDRKGDRIDARLDRRGELLAQRVEHRHQHRHEHRAEHRDGWPACRDDDRHRGYGGRR